MGLGRRFMHVLHVFLLYSMLSLLLLGCTYVDSSTSSSGAGSKISNGNSVGVGGDGASVSTSTTAHIPSCASLESISSGDEQKCQTSGSKPVELSIYRAVAGGILKQCDVYPQTGCDLKGVEQYAMKASIDDDWKNKAPYRAYANFKARMSDSVYVQDFESKQFENTQVIYESDDGTVSAVLDQGADQTVVHGLEITESPAGKGKTYTRYLGRMPILEPEDLEEDVDVPSLQGLDLAKMTVEQSQVWLATRSFLAVNGGLVMRLSCEDCLASASNSNSNSNSDRGSNSTRDVKDGARSKAETQKGVAAVGFFISDLHDKGADLTLKVYGAGDEILFQSPMLRAKDGVLGGTVNSGHTENGNVNFFGIVSTHRPISKLSLTVTQTEEEFDYFGVDKLIIAEKTVDMADDGADGDNTNQLCGNGILDPGEECDFVLDPDHCTQDCKCMFPFIKEASGICGLCGNGRVDLTEECDVKLDPEHCEANTCNCVRGWVQDLDDLDSGMCTQCGNEQLDEGEECDDGLDPNYCENCMCVESQSDGSGMCQVLCGNGQLDAGEECDPEMVAFGNPACDTVECKCEEEILGGKKERYLQQALPCLLEEGYCNYCGDGRLGHPHEECDDDDDEHCNRCQCDDGYEPADRHAGCVLICGNGRLDAGEQCDDRQDVNCVECQCTGSTVSDRIYRTGACTLCGNGVVDMGEQCDHGLTGLSSTITHCDDTCMCEAPYVPHPHRPNECYIPCSSGSGSGGGGGGGSDSDSDGGSCCLNGVLDDGEECEPELTGHCTQTCKCDDRWAPDLNDRGVCVNTCGDGIFQVAHEVCDTKVDSSGLCDQECRACNGLTVSDGKGGCTLCGNDQLDIEAGEECDKGLSSLHCTEDCKCVPATLMSKTVVGTCTHHCGDGSFQPLMEECESRHDPDHCSINTCECVSPFTSNGIGACMNCGNQIVERPGEGCDNSKDLHCDHLRCVCDEGFVPAGREGACVKETCENGAESCCGDGKFDRATEDCEYTLIFDPQCDQECRCMLPYISDGQGACRHSCGDGIFQPEIEQCDTALDPQNCNDDCQSCKGGSKDHHHAGPAYVPDAVGKGTCTLCGNNVHDAGEECEWRFDPDQCGHETCACIDKLPGQEGKCSDVPKCECGNDVFEPDSGEMCDGTANCVDSLCKCEAGYLPDGLGGCVRSNCGDFIVAEGLEECDGGPGCDFDCTCYEGLVPGGWNGCVGVCGNGVRTGDEQCDEGWPSDSKGKGAGDAIAVGSKRTCLDTCKCKAHYKPTVPLSSVCVPMSTCGNGLLDPSEMCDGGPHCNKDCRCDQGFFAVVATKASYVGGYGCESVCGDFVVSADEECDGGDHCNNECRCNSGFKPIGEIGCSAACGDGIVVQGEEQCDGGEGCGALCMCKAGFASKHPAGKDCEPACGNGRLDSGEFCDGGLNCLSTCRCMDCYEPDGGAGTSTSTAGNDSGRGRGRGGGSGDQSGGAGSAHMPGCKKMENCKCGEGADSSSSSSLSSSSLSSSSSSSSSSDKALSAMDVVDAKDDIASSSTVSTIGKKRKSSEGGSGNGAGDHSYVSPAKKRKTTRAKDDGATPIKLLQASSNASLHTLTIDGAPVSADDFGFHLGEMNRQHKRYSNALKRLAAVTGTTLKATPLSTASSASSASSTPSSVSLPSSLSEVASSLHRLHGDYKPSSSSSSLSTTSSSSSSSSSSSLSSSLSSSSLLEESASHTDTQTKMQMRVHSTTHASTATADHDGPALDDKLRQSQKRYLSALKHLGSSLKSKVSSSSPSPSPSPSAFASASASSPPSSSSVSSFVELKTRTSMSSNHSKSLH